MEWSEKEWHRVGEIHNYLYQGVRKSRKEWKGIEKSGKKRYLSLRRGMNGKK